MTEEAFFSSAAQKDAFNELDVEKYEIVATLDSHTSEICRELDSKVFPMKEYQPGVTAPPFHVWCRSTTVPYFDDNFGSVGERAARGEDGKTYYVPANMKYNDWMKSFVDTP
jgi:NAD+--asparagine ADP-ribosyltransferase